MIWTVIVIVAFSLGLGSTFLTLGRYFGDRACQGWEMLLQDHEEAALRAYF